MVFAAPISFQFFLNFSFSAIFFFFLFGSEKKKESSMNSMSRSSPPYEVDHHLDSPEESSWTMYFEDFSNKNNNDFIFNDENNGSSSFSSDIYNQQSSSLVSDAACSAAATRHVSGAPNLDNKSLSFKKRKAKGVLIEDDLEDTASSPANSPKVYNLVNHFDKNLKQKDIMDISQEKGSGSGQIGERIDDELGFIGRENDGTELKKRGLCLVPLSMVVDYLG